jgi:hypothetical protein
MSHVLFSRDTFFIRDTNGTFTGAAYSCTDQTVVPWEFSQQSEVKFTALRNLVSVIRCIKENVPVFSFLNRRYERVGYPQIDVENLSSKRYSAVDHSEDQVIVYSSKTTKEYVKEDPTGDIYLIRGKYVKQEYFDTRYLDVPELVSPHFVDILPEFPSDYRDLLKGMIDLGFLLPEFLSLTQDWYK